MLIAIAKQRILCHNINNESKLLNDIKKQPKKNKTISFLLNLKKMKNKFHLKMH